MTVLKSATAEAFANIALIKYWGKLSKLGNYPAVPSLSLTLAALRTETTVSPLDDGPEDEVLLDGEPAAPRAKARILAALDTIREAHGSRSPIRVVTRNEFPTAAGLASSASGFAALICSANAAFGTNLSHSEQSALARSASASAARSLFGGFATLEVGRESAESLAPSDYWDLVFLVAVTAEGKKSVGSTDAMNLTRTTSPYYPAWLSTAPALFAEAKQAVLDRDLEKLGCAMEHSTLMMHATMWATVPAVIYQAPPTLSVISEVRRIRQAGTPAFFTMDAGPHVKVLCNRADAERIQRQLSEIDGVRQVIVSSPGGPARQIG